MNVRAIGQFLQAVIENRGLNVSAADIDKYNEARSFVRQLVSGELSVVVNGREDETEAPPERIPARPNLR